MFKRNPFAYELILDRLPWNYIGPKQNLSRKCLRSKGVGFKDLFWPAKLSNKLVSILHMHELMISALKIERNSHFER